ncbi:MAG: discoidin domain-containing protein, partial [Terriglobia bacterium]
QELTSSSQKVGQHLKTCCIVLEGGKLNPDQFQRCIETAQNYEAKLIKVVASLDDAQTAKQQNNLDLVKTKVEQINSELDAAKSSSKELEKQVAALPAVPGRPSGRVLAAPDAQTPGVRVSEQKNSVGEEPGPASASSLLRGEDVKNLAALKEGGHIVSFSSQYNNTDWNIEHLLDGAADKGWAGQNNGAQSVVIAFKDNALAEIHDVLINPYTREDSSNWAKDIEIQVSTTYPFRDFRSVGKFTLKKEGSDQVFSFPQPTQARYVKIRFLSNYKGAYMEAGEVQVMGRLLPQAPAAPVYSNVAAAAKGAKIEKYTSQYDESTWAVGNLLKDDGDQQWAGKSAESQEVIITLPDATQITDIAINNYSKENPNTWAKDVEVEVSSTFSYKGFSPVGKISMPQIGDLHTISLTAPVAAKYVKVLFRSNHGGSYMEAARIRVYKTEAGGKKALAQQLAETGRAVVHE